MSEDSPNSSSPELKSDDLEGIPPAEKKTCQIKNKRSLIDHNLDQLLVYTKRERKSPPINDTLFNQKHKITKKRKLQEEIKVLTKIKTHVDTNQFQIPNKQFKEKPSPKQVAKKQPIKPRHFNLWQEKNKNQKEASTGTEKPKQYDQKLKISDKNQVYQQKSIVLPITRQKSKKKQKIIYKDSEQEEPVKFPFQNQFFWNVEDAHISYLSKCEQIKLKTEGHPSFHSKTFINCDVRFFNWNFFADKVGSFDVVLIDPPWRIKGAQQNDSQFMFSNCKFSLQYNTMSNTDIQNIQIGRLSKCGFIFLWILNTQLGSSLEIMNKWGYQLVDTLIWVKLKNNKVFLTNGFYFMHSYQMCLIGYKSHPDKKVQTSLAISNNLLFAEVRKKSQKPDELYHMIEMMFPKNKRVEVFARNNNLRFGWFSLGNELGQSYDKWLLTIDCDRCSCAIVPRVKRFKSRQKANYDLCQRCIKEQQKNVFYEIQNQVTENIIHLYRSCNHCESEPIWGNRFECKVCANYDLCEGCFDHNLQLSTPFHDVHHDMEIVQVPIFGHGFPIHDVKCCQCFQKPIIGICFACNICKNFNLCQKCFFQSMDTKFKRHSCDHSMEAIFDPSLRPLYRKFQCFSCSKQIMQNCHLCQNCYNFFFCDQCFEKRDSFKTNMANNHKDFHKFIKIF